MDELRWMKNHGWRPEIGGKYVQDKIRLDKLEELNFIEDMKQ